MKNPIDSKTKGLHFSSEVIGEHVNQVLYKFILSESQFVHLQDGDLTT